MMRKSNTDLLERATITLPTNGRFPPNSFRINPSTGYMRRMKIHMFLGRLDIKSYGRGI
jgi:hypothetical protein